MRKGTIKAAVLIIIFIIAVVVSGNVMNHSNVDLTTEMDDATIPVITLYYGETQINELHGYSSEMDAAYMRDTITPIGDGRKLPILIQTYQTAVDSVSYEIRSLDAARLVAEAKAEDLNRQKGQISGELKIQNLLSAGEEYLLIIKLDSAGENIYYYTRIIEPEDAYIDECLNFVQDFHNKTFNSETTGTLATYMEKTTGDNTTLQYVSLNSSLKQIGWGSFNPRHLTDPVISLKEITDTYSVYVMTYVATSIGSGGESEYYNVEEYYRVRYTSSRMYMLDFERTVNQIFRAEDDNISEDGILLGIRAADIEYKYNNAGTNIAFVQEGELWSYDVSANTLAKVFSFRGYEGIDNRENFGEHDIRIVSVDEVGNIDYIVYGYMNRGNHEGEVGIAVYRYDSQANTNEEEAFWASDRPYEVMKSELGKFMYVNDSGKLFLMMDSTLYGVDLNTLETEKAVENLRTDASAFSVSNRYVAWGDGEDTAAIHVIDLQTMETTDIKETGKYTVPLGFMQEDLVYGVARRSDIGTDAAGNTIVPMYQIKITDISGDEPVLQKQYEKDGYYVESVEIDDATMYLNRIKYNGSAYVQADQDMIMNREGDTEGAVTVGTAYSDDKETQLLLRTQGISTDKKTKLLTPKETILEELPFVTLEKEDSSGFYYVYAKGHLVLSTDNVASAVSTANEQMGVVIDDSQQYIWKRSRRTSVSAIRDISQDTDDADTGSITLCINAMLQKENINVSVGAMIQGGESPKNVLQNTMREMTVIDLTGCDVEETLYYISLGNPVFAMTGNNSAVLLTGYDSSGVTIYDPLLKMSHRETLTAAKELFQTAGNIFLTYIN